MQNVYFCIFHRTVLLSREDMTRARGLRNLSRRVRLLHGWGDRRRHGRRGRVVVAAPVWPPGIDSRRGARGDVMASRLRQ